MTDDLSKYRPPADQRMTNSTALPPVEIQIRTGWLYSESDDCLCCPGRHAFSRGATVVASPVPSRYDHMNSVNDHVYRAVELFGDDADLIIEVRRA